MTRLSLSVTVMAHESRRKWFPYLKQKLGDVPFLVDNDKLKLGTWGNCRRAWLAQDMSAEYVLVIQDDAIICEGFIDKARDFVAAHPDASYQFFFGNRQSTKNILKESATKEDGYIVSSLMWGVAICLPTALIPEMVRWCDRLPDNTPDDTRIKKFLSHKGIDTYYPYPSLIDHRGGPSLAGSRNDHRFAIDYIDRKTLPKIIHQIWVGPKVPPHRWINTWNVKGWQHKVWREKDIDELGMKNRKLYDYYYKKGVWHGAADVARLEILKKYGGIYVDADTRRMKPFLDLSFFNSEFFAVQAQPRPGHPYRVANGVMGSQPDHPILNEYIERMGKAEKVEPCWSTVGGTMFTEILQGYTNDPNVVILEPYTFYPFSSWGYRDPNRHKAIARHYWGSTKGLY